MSEELAKAEIVLPVKTPEPQSSKMTRMAAFTPVNLTEAVALAKLISSSELAPKDYRGKPGNVLIAMQLGAEIGLAPMQAIQNVAVINGRPSVWGDAMLALVQVHPDYEGHKEFMEGTGETRTAVFQVKRRNQEWHQQKYSVADAKQAGLWGKVGPWKTNSDRMLQMRARGFGLRDKFADALKGLRLAEESMDLPPEKPGSDKGTLDIGREITSMTASAEPNRGHGNEAMAKHPSLAAAPGMDQTSKKQEDVICAECRKVNGHEASCIYNQACPECHAPAGKPHASKCSLKDGAKADEPKTEKQTNKRLIQIQSIKELTKKGTANVYLVCSVVDAQGDEWEFTSWDTKHHPFLREGIGQNGVLEFSENEKNGRKYTNLEHIISLGSQDFVNDAPAESDDWDGK